MIGLALKETSCVVWLGVRGIIRSTASTDRGPKGLPIILEALGLNEGKIVTLPLGDTAVKLMVVAVLNSLRPQYCEGLRTLTLTSSTDALGVCKNSSLST